MAKDFYKILGVSKSASKDEIKSAYKKLAKEYHPDLNKDPSAAEKFKEINEAASILGDDEKRKQYDQHGEDAFKYAGAGGQGGQYRNYDFSGFDFSSFGGDFDSIFDMFTGGMGGRRRNNNGRDLAYELSISLKEAADGVKKKIKVTKNDVCEECDGAGGTDVKDCPTCRGTGSVREVRRTPFGVFQTTTTCRECEGSGETFKESCKHCEGTGRTRSTKTLEVNIPAGIMDNSRLRISGEGEAGYRGATPGDLYIIVHIEEDEHFERQGDDLLTEVEVNFTQAALGDKLKLETLSGNSTLRVPPGTQPGDIIRLKGEGMKRMHGFGRGDLLVKIKVTIPKNLDKKQEKLLKELQDSISE
jgi:molecular chaperone DnaJ